MKFLKKLKKENNFDNLVYGDIQNKEMNHVTPLRIFRAKDSTSPTSNHSKSVNYFSAKKNSTVLEPLKRKSIANLGYEIDDSPSKKKRVRQKLLRSIDHNLRKRESYKNNFGLDFTLLNDPKYNPFPKRNNDSIQSSQKSLFRDQSTESYFTSKPSMETSQIYHMPSILDSAKKLSCRLNDPEGNLHTIFNNSERKGEIKGKGLSKPKNHIVYNRENKLKIPEIK